MFTNNYYAILINSQMNSIKLPLKSISEYSFSPKKADTWEFLEFDITPKENFSNIIFGAGITQPTRADFKLSGDQIEGLELENQSSSYEMLEKKVSATKQLFIKNPKSEPVTIGEIGWTADIPYGDSSLTRTVLLDRTILETPITIPAGKQAQINYTISWERGS